MSDNTRINNGGGGDLISTDEITTINGVVIATGEKVQRIKLGFGSDSILRDVDSANPLPVSGALSTKTSLTPSAPTFSTVGTASASTVAANATRKGLSLTNTSVNRISLGFGAAAVLDSGITLYAGDSFIMDEYSFHTAAVNAIANVAASNLAIQEYV